MSNEAIALLINDVHVSKENIDQFKLNWKEALDVAIFNGVNRILIGGDLFTSRHSQTLDVLLAVYDVFQECMDNNINVFILEGNHDKVNQESNRGYCSVFRSFDNVYVVEDWSCLKFGDVVVGMISYFPENGSFANMLGEISKELDTVNYDHSVLYIHEGIKGALPQPADTDLPADIFSCWDKVLVGHYHDRCVVKGTNIEYIGSSRQHGFGEDEEKGYTLLYSDGSTKFVKNTVNVRYVTLRKRYDEIFSGSFKDEVMSYTSNNYKVRVIIECKAGQSNSVNKSLLFDMGISKVELIDESSPIKIVSQESLNERYDKSGIIKMYHEFCDKNSIGNVDFGVKYLNPINSCGN